MQNNHSLPTDKGAIRGLHFQIPPLAQAKLSRVTAVAIFDVAVDIRWVLRALAATSPPCSGLPTGSNIHARRVRPGQLTNGGFFVLKTGFVK